MSIVPLALFKAKFDVRLLVAGFCIKRGALHSLLHGDFRQKHSPKIYIVILVYAIGIRSDFRGLCMSS